MFSDSLIRSSTSHRSVVSRLFAFISRFVSRNSFFAGVPFAPSVAQIPQRVVAFLNFEIHQQVVRVLDSLFLHRIGAVFFTSSRR
jgi:hypothetical protein